MKSKRVWMVWLSLLLPTLAGSEFSIQKPYEELPVGMCGMPQLPPISADQFFRTLQQTNPVQYQRLLEAEQSLRRFNQMNLTQQKFWAYDMKKEEFYQVTATLRKAGNLTNIWVEDDSWENGYVTQDEVDAIYEALEIRSGTQSLNPDLGIVEIDTFLFGQPPNKDGDGIIDFLILDIRDSFDPEEKNSQFIAGYFHPWDQTDNATSNKRDLLYLDAYPGIFFNDRRSTDKVLSTTAHELQHLIHYHYDPDESTWVNEGLSELAGVYCGYGLDFPYLYLKDTNRGLMNWSGDIADYARVGLWTLYTAEQFGVEFIRALVQEKANGRSGYQTTLEKLGYSLSFEEVFKNWAIALYVNNTAIDTRYGYYHTLAGGLSADFRETVIQYPYQTSFAIQSYAPVYFRFRGADTLWIDFAGAAPEGFWVHRSTAQFTLEELRSNSLEIPGFNPEDQFVLLLTNTNAMQEISFQAFAPYSVRMVELQYDDGELNYDFTTTGIGANKFLTPTNNLSLRRVKFYNLQSGNAYRVYVYDEGIGGRPGQELLAPMDTTVQAARSWVEMELPQALQLPRKNQAFFVGLQVITPDRALPYDHQESGNGRSYLNVGGGWRRLSDFRTGDGTALTGYWMIRAVLEGGLIPSGEPSDFDTTLAEFKITIAPISEYNSYNPAGEEIQFQVELNSSGRLELILYNILGQKITEIRRDFPNKGRYLIPWNGRNQWGNIVPSGMYFYRATFYSRESVRELSPATGKVILLK